MYMLDPRTSENRETDFGDFERIIIIFTNAFPSDYVEPDRTDCDHLHDAVITTNKIRALCAEIRGLSVGF